MHPLVDILGNPDAFLDGLLKQIESKGIDIGSLDMDHICYRVETLEEYTALNARLLEYGNLLSDKWIGGRPISVIELYQPYTYNQRNIKVIELPSPKAGSPYSKGYEHVEFVVEMDLIEFVESYPTIEFDLKGMTKAINRDARLSLNGCSVKFHEHPLKYVIEELES